LKLASVAEVIEALLPIIERLAGRKASSYPASAVIEVVASAVRSAATLDCTSDLAADAVKALRRAGRLTENDETKSEN
jgi:hypothetical protein